MVTAETKEHRCVTIDGVLAIAWRPCADVFVMDNALSDIECALAEHLDDTALIFRRDLYEGRRCRLMRLCQL